MNDLLPWLNKNAALLSSLASLLMVAIWIFYAYLFHRDFKGRYNPQVIIHQAPDTGLDSLCIIVNLGQQMINLVAVTAVAHTDDGRIAREITQYRRTSSDWDNDWQLRSVLKQGPLASGEPLHLGSFQEILDDMAIRVEDRDGGDGAGGEKSFTLEIRGIFYVGSRAEPIGFQRFFTIDRQAERAQVVPTTLKTVQLVTFWQKKRVKHWLNTLP
jgi:hypothetical protein